MTSFTVEDIPAGSFCTKPVYLDGQFILTAPEMPFSKEIINILKEWEFTEINSEGTFQADYAAEDEPAEAAGQNQPADMDTAVPGEALTGDLSDGEALARAKELFAGFLQYTETLFNQIAAQNVLDLKAVVRRMQADCEIVIQNRRFLLRILKNTEPGSSQNYLASHTVNTTILTIIIGNYLKLPANRLIELGISSLFHEIGMLKLSPDIYLNTRALNAQEQKAILTHPILGYNMLKAFGCPLPVCLAALEHHERENGSGYPRKLTGDKISLYAKIIAVACSYDALTTNRPYKDAKDGYAGMLDLLKNEGKQYNNTVIRALVFSLSIYPIGMYVLLSNGQKGQVVDVNPAMPQYPIVQVLGEVNAGGKVTTIATAPDGTSIVKLLQREEIGSP
jgi:HD-GYP domain-containing protein (c-di-GMP phosphodiesterase class II)